MEVIAHRCERCGRIVPPRGNEVPRYCPQCGDRLSDEPVPYHASEAKVSALAVIAFVLALLSLLGTLSGAPIGFFALFLGWSAQSRIDDSGGRLRGRGLATAALVVGLITGAYWLLIRIW